uniref:Uncharacterized protein n=1 Tax=Oryza nivara TaxID=4536 RepID=A0A0E0IP63_ORYNI
MVRTDYESGLNLFSIIIILMAVCTAETGLTRFIFHINGYMSKAFVVNFAGLAILMFDMAVILAVTLPLLLLIHSGAANHTQSIASASIHVASIAASEVLSRTRFK